MFLVSSALRAKSIFDSVSLYKHESLSKLLKKDSPLSSVELLPAINDAESSDFP